MRLGFKEFEVLRLLLRGVRRISNILAIFTLIGFSVMMVLEVALG